MSLKLLISATIMLVHCVPAPSLSKSSAQVRANFYKPTLIREARARFGINAPVALFAAQIHQESLWRKNARSKYANGLTQFTPSTERWIKTIYPKSLGKGSSFNPRWAIRALVTYDQFLYKRVVKKSTNACHAWAFTLASYNGGLGWVYRDMKLTAKKVKNKRKWWGHVEHYSRRANWAIKENRDYPKKIIYRHQKKYTTWGGKIICLN